MVICHCHHHLGEIRWVPISFLTVRTDNTADDFRSKIFETDVLARLVGLFQDWNERVRWSSVISITTLVKFGGLLYYF